MTEEEKPPNRKKAISDIAIEMGKSDIDPHTIGKSLGLLCGGNVEFMVRALFSGWGDPVARREVLLGATEQIDVAAVIVRIEMESVDFDRLRAYLHSESKTDSKTAAAILLHIRDKILRKGDWIGLVHSLLDDREELERTETACTLFANLITEAVRSHFAADNKNDPQADAEYLELLRDKLSEELTKRIAKLREEDEKEKEKEKEKKGGN